MQERTRRHVRSDPRVLGQGEGGGDRGQGDGRQNEPEVFGKSITDPCLGWDNTVQLIEEIYNTLDK